MSTSLVLFYAFRLGIAHSLYICIYIYLHFCVVSQKFFFTRFNQLDSWKPKRYCHSAQSKPESNGNEVVPQTPHISRTGVSPSNSVYCVTQDIPFRFFKEISQQRIQSAYFKPRWQGNENKDKHNAIVKLNIPVISILTVRVNSSKI